MNIPFQFSDKSESSCEVQFKIPYPPTRSNPSAKIGLHQKALFQTKGYPKVNLSESDIKSEIKLKELDLEEVKQTIFFNDEAQDQNLGESCFITTYSR